jgi:hypothetical protein
VLADVEWIEKPVLIGLAVIAAGRTVVHHLSNHRAAAVLPGATERPGGAWRAPSLTVAAALAAIDVLAR